MFFVFELLVFYVKLCSGTQTAVQTIATMEGARISTERDVSMVVFVFWI